jgi:hypothetical protein
LIHIHTVATADTIPAILPIPASVPELSPCPPPESFGDELGLDAGGAEVDAGAATVAVATVGVVTVGAATVAVTVSVAAV